MRQQGNIQWWCDNVPDLSNWNKVNFEKLDANDQAFLNNYAANSPFINELRDDTSAATIVNVNSVAQNSTSRIFQAYKLGRSSTWIWISSIATILLLISTVVYINSLNNKTDQTKQNTAYSEEIQNENTHTKEVANEEDGNQESTQEISLINNENDNSSFSSEIDGDQTGDKNITVDTKETIFDDEISDEKTENTLVTKETQEKQIKKKKFTGTGFKLTGDASKIKKPTRDSSVKLEIQQATVEQVQNYATFLNNIGGQSGTTNGELSGDAKKTPKTIKFSPADITSFPGGNERLEEHLKLELSRVNLSEEYHHPVSVMASFTVNPKGQIEHLTINGNETNEVKRAVRNTLNSLSGWKKGKKTGKKGTAYYEILISFN